MDRPRINTFAYDKYRPGKIVVCKAEFRSDPRRWQVWRGMNQLGAYETHSEAMSAAVKLAHSWAGETPGELVQLFREPPIFEPLVG